MPSNALLSLSCGHGRVQETKSQNFFEFSLELGPLENSYPSLVSSGPLKDSQMQCWPSALTLAFRRMTALVSCGPVQGRVCNFGQCLLCHLTSHVCLRRGLVFCLTNFLLVIAESRLPGFSPAGMNGGKHSLCKKKKKNLDFCNLLSSLSDCFAILICILI